MKINLIINLSIASPISFLDEGFWAKRGQTDALTICKIVVVILDEVTSIGGTFEGCWFEGVVDCPLSFWNSEVLWFVWAGAELDSWLKGTLDGVGVCFLKCWASRFCCDWFWVLTVVGWIEGWTPLTLSFKRSI